MLRDIIKIDEQKCTGCGLCIPGCPEGAIQLIDGKARLVSDLSCDGLGACLGHCPEGAIEIEKREAEPYDERAVMENIIKAGPNTVAAHLEHLADHGETGYLAEAHRVLKERGIEVPKKKAAAKASPCGGGCPGSASMNLAKTAAAPDSIGQESALGNWPVQLHLMNPRANYLKGADLLLSADCAAHAAGDFHRRFLKGKILAIACPKLDSGTDAYIEKLALMIDESEVNTITVVIMEVPCCGGLTAIAQKAAAKAGRKVPIKMIRLSLRGEVIGEQWL